MRLKRQDSRKVPASKRVLFLCHYNSSVSVFVRISRN